MGSKTFMYFGYGSNLLQQRIRLRNPSAQFYGIGKLKDHQIHFCWSKTLHCLGVKPNDSRGWRGCPASIRPLEKSNVWGVVWKMDMKDMASLDKQEGVEQGIYKAFNINVTLNTGEEVECRTYRIVDFEDEYHLPSPQYLDIIIRGALQNKLPEDYVEKLKQEKTNGNAERVQVYEDVLKLCEN